ncbi:hypothetical protein NQ314_013321 [Rhamnusium bicolor]|uniref:LysM domain-containing protein n=1 Tax=Rhamnusium bicolor TaxID=1586634 RepID=A0AAV8X6N6_9CUCU|nr:hypothetical protein NQ314_013321 [Rhamnusium bicolor]
MDRGSYEKLSIRDSARSLKKYGSTSRHVTRNENYIKHFVSNTDTLQGIALKYNVTIEQIRRANKLWASDSLFLREFLLIPSTEIQAPSSEQETPVVSPSAVSSPPISGSFDEDNIDEFLSKIDAAIANTKEEVKKTTINSAFAANVDSDGERRRPAVSRMKQMVNNNSSSDLYHPPHTVVVQQGKKVRTSIKQHEQLQDELFEL